MEEREPENEPVVPEKNQMDVLQYWKSGVEDYPRNFRDSREEELTVTSGNLVNIIVNKNADGVREYKCEYGGCDFVTTHPGAITSHQRNCYPYRKYWTERGCPEFPKTNRSLRCLLCENAFLSEGERALHIQMVHLTAVKRKFPHVIFNPSIYRFPNCVTREEWFSIESNWTICLVCERPLKTPHTLLNHLRLTHFCG